MIFIHSILRLINQFHYHVFLAKKLATHCFFEILLLLYKFSGKLFNLWSMKYYAIKQKFARADL